MSEVVYAQRWQQIMDTRPKAPNGEPRPGSLAYAYVRWQTNAVERVRVMNMERDGTVRIQRITSSAMLSVDIGELRSHEEVLDYCHQHHAEHMPPKVKDFDPTRLPPAVRLEIWERLA